MLVSNRVHEELQLVTDSHAASGWSKITAQELSVTRLPTGHFHLHLDEFPTNASTAKYSEKDLVLRGDSIWLYDLKGKPQEEETETTIPDEEDCWENMSDLDTEWVETEDLLLNLENTDLCLHI